MKKNNLFLLVFTMIFSLAFFSGCNSEEEIADSQIAFTIGQETITTDDLSPVTYTITITPEAPLESSITVGFSVTGGEVGVAITTDPAPTGNQLVLPVSAGATSVTFDIVPLEEGIAYDDIQIDLEIIDAGEGLEVAVLANSFSQLIIQNNKAAGAEELPYTEDFLTMSHGSTDFPLGWHQVVVAQHLGEPAQWIFSGFPGEGGLEINPWDANGAIDDPAEIWMISPRISLIDATNPTFDFKVDRRFDTWDPTSGNFDPIDFQEYDVFISADYDGNNFDEATWTLFQPAIDAFENNDPGQDDYTYSGPMDISEYANELISIAVVYYSASQAAATILRFGDITIE